MVLSLQPHTLQRMTAPAHLAGAALRPVGLASSARTLSRSLPFSSVSSTIRARASRCARSASIICGFRLCVVAPSGPIFIRPMFAHVCLLSAARPPHAARVALRIALCGSDAAGPRLWLVMDRWNIQARPDCPPRWRAPGNNKWHIFLELIY